MNKIYDVNNVKYCSRGSLIQIDGDSYNIPTVDLEIATCNCIDSYQAELALKKYLSTCEIVEHPEFKS